MRRVHQIGIVLLGALLSAGGGVRAQSSGGLVPDGVPADVALVFTGDTIGYIEPCG